MNNKYQTVFQHDRSKNLITRKMLIFIASVGREVNLKGMCPKVL